MMMADQDRDQSTPTLDYQTPIKPASRPSSLAFWTRYTIAYVPGLVILSVVSDAIDMYTRGHHSDGEIFFLGVYAFPVFAILLGIVREAFDRDAIFAAVYGVFVPTATLLLFLLFAFLLR
jgi:hypothetical protein